MLEKWAMGYRAAIVVGSLVLVSGLVLWDYDSAESRRTREIHQLEVIAPHAEVPGCFPQHLRAKVFAGTIYVDKHAPESVREGQVRSLLMHDCVRGADKKGSVERLAVALGDEGVPLYQGVIERCKVERRDVSPPACFALDALARVHTPRAVAALEGVLQSRKGAKEVQLGALYRLLTTAGWKTRAQLAGMVAAETTWEAKDLIIEKIREERDPSAKPALQRAFEAEADLREKGKLKAALLEIDNPGRCVAEDLGEGSGGLCRYVCKDQNVRPQFPKAGAVCALVRDFAPAVAAVGPPVN